MAFESGKRFLSRFVTKVDILKDAMSNPASNMIPNMHKPKMSRPKEVLRGSHRAGVADSQKGTGFFIDFSSSGAAPKKNIIPKRLQEYGQSKRLSSEDLMEKQRMAEERKKKHDEERIHQARKVREEAMRYDQSLRKRLPENQKLEDKKWYSASLPKKK